MGNASLPSLKEVVWGIVKYVSDIPFETFQDVLSLVMGDRRNFDTMLAEVDDIIKNLLSYGGSRILKG